MEKLKAWAIEVVIKQGGPSACRGVVLGVSAWLLAKEGILSSFGVVSNAAAHTTTIFWDKVSMALIAGLPALIAAVVKMTQHHGEDAIKKIQEKGEIQ